MAFTRLLCASSSWQDVSHKESTISLVYRTDKSQSLVTDFISLLGKQEIQIHKKY
jgi:hypothetical protein